MDELACFAPGMIALGSFGYGPEDSQKFLSLAEEVYFISHTFVFFFSFFSVSVFATVHGISRGGSS